MRSEFEVEMHQAVNAHLLKGRDAKIVVRENNIKEALINCDLCKSWFDLKTFEVCSVCSKVICPDCFHSAEMCNYCHAVEVD